MSDSSQAGGEQYEQLPVEQPDLSLHPGGRFQGGEVVRLVFRAEPADVPVWQRVRALLKHAGRTLKLRCVEAVDVTPKLPPLPAALTTTEPAVSPHVLAPAEAALVECEPDVPHELDSVIERSCT